MPAVTGTEIVSGAFALLNVFLPGESVPAADGEYARSLLNDWLNEMSQRTLYIPVVARERFDMTTGKGSPTNPYTIGPGGDWDTERPSNQDSITGANLVLTQTTPEVRVPLTLFTDDGYDSNSVPSQTSVQPIGLYYNPTYANDLGSVYLWPVPSVSYNDIELFLQKGVSPFTSLAGTFYVPDGVPRMLKYGLAVELQAPYGREMSATAAQIAISSMSTFKRSNVKLTDVANDAGGLGGPNGIYNILSDTKRG